MEWVETTGITLEAAKEAALDELGVDEHDAEFEVLQEPKIGLFGRIRAEARIRARVRPTAPRAKEDRRDRRRSRNRETSAEVGGGSRSAASKTMETDESSTAGEGTGASRSRRRRGGGSREGAGVRGASGSEGEVRGAVGTVDRDGRTEDLAAERDGPSAGAGTAGRSSPNGAEGSRSRRNRGRSGRNGGQRTGNTAGQGEVGEAGNGRPSRAAQSKSNDKAGEGPTVEVPLEEQGRIAEEFLRGLVAQFGLRAQISIKQPDEDNVEVAVTGDDLGLLIGPKGATLLAIQDLTRTVVQRKTSAGNGRIHVDVGGYREKRANALANFARQVAAQVVETGARRALEPMTAADRKVVHDALNGVDGVQTLSEGEEPQRRVVIIPASAS
ncbi:MAG: Jag N-terminal domain-containing protein [Acidimicrobiaceae bacterium]|nr:Jag N-terminal domain-containing protein [Acidimicrobiaceae bacterium]